MEELHAITSKYTPKMIRESLSSLESLNRFAFAFFNDVANIYDCLVRLKNIDRNPTGFSLEDAPILGLLVRVSKLLKEVVAYYERDNAEIIAVLERPLIEAAITATYLMQHGPEVLLDYRKCSYKDRLRILQQMDAGSPFMATKPGQRLLKSVLEKLAADGFSRDDFALQAKRKWRLQGKSFRDIFAEVDRDDFYPASYGIMSESIHGSWNESLDWCLSRQEDGTFKAHPFSYPADVRFVTPTLRYTQMPFRLWVRRVDVSDEPITGILDWIDKVNATLYAKFDAHYDGAATRAPANQ